MATDAERARLRRDVGANEDSLPDYDADDIFVEAAEVYSNATTAAAYARVLAIQGLLASSARLVSYRQNQSSEDASDVFEHLSRLLKLWQDETAEAQKLAGSGAMRFGRTGKKPTRIREYPDN